MTVNQETLVTLQRFFSVVVSKKPRGNGREKAEGTPSTAKRTARKGAINYQEESEEEITQPKSPKPTPKAPTPPKQSTKKPNGKLVIPDSDSDQELPQVRAKSPTPKKASVKSKAEENGQHTHLLQTPPASKYPLRLTPTRHLTPTTNSDTQTINDAEAPMNAAQREVLDKMKPVVANGNGNCETKMNAAQLDIINKLKSGSSVFNHSPGGVKSSPLALGNLEKKGSVVLVKKRKNVPKATVSTQTDKSYIADMRKINGHL